MAKQLVSLVTGGASGLGKATVERLLQQSGKVVICDLPSSNGAEFARNYGNDVLFTPADICSETDMINVLKATKEKFGRLDNVVNCAAIYKSFKIYNFNRKVPQKLEDFESVIKVNLIGTFNVVRLAVGLIGENAPSEDGQRGVIINTSCTSATDGQMGQICSAASKAGVNGMTLPLARDLATQGIRVVTIAPGLFDTPILEYLPEKVKKFLADNMTFPNRFGKPSEYAQLVTSIIENPLLNGEIIRLDGGLRLTM